MKHNKVKSLKTKKQVERSKSLSHNLFKTSLLIIASFVLFLSILIVGYIVVMGASGFFKFDQLNIFSFLFNNKYDGVTLFAAGFMVINTLWTSLIAIIITIPISVITALFITRVAPKWLRTTSFILLSILAAVPSVIYGAFGSKIIDSLVMLIFHTQTGSLFTIVVTLSFMIMPTVTLITATSINVVDKRLEHSSLALGATRNQTSFKITLRAASTGILTGAILGIGRALGEATAVSMISVDPYTGPSFGLFEQIRLLTATMLKGYAELDPGSVQEASMFAMGMMLIITILVVFLSLRYIQKISTPEFKSKKANQKLKKIRRIEQNVSSKGLNKMSIVDQKRYGKIRERHKIQKEVDKYYHNQYKMEEAWERTTIKKSHDRQKERTSKALGILTWAVAAIGIIFLASIIVFLLFGGASTLSWNLISSSGQININGININGLQPAIFGTILLILMSIALIIPLGIGTGIYFAVFANKKSKITNALILGIDILSGIPSLIFGLVGAVVFLPFAKLIGFIPLAGSIILTLIITPTVVQTTKEAIINIPSGMIKGSLALGSTKTTSTLKISIPKAMPQIISGVILSIGRIIGESAALIMILGTVSRNSISDWTQFGGTTLATEMYSLTLLEVIPWNVVTAIGLVIMSLVLLLSLLAHYISEKYWLTSSGVILSTILILASILIDEWILFIVGVLLLMVAIILKIVITNLKKR